MTMFSSLLFEHSADLPAMQVLSGFLSGEKSPQELGVSGVGDFGAFLWCWLLSPAGFIPFRAARSAGATASGVPMGRS